MDLCRQSSDRQSKLLACESLHSLVTYMIGTSAMDPQRSMRSTFVDCYSVIFPTVIYLASSIDIICRDMFSRLLLQIIHWFSGRGQVHESEVSVLLNALMWGISDRSDMTTRDVCAMGLVEFFSWSIKQSSPAELKIDCGVVDLLIVRYNRMMINANIIMHY
jgi:DNA-dependent protein kinase catalytic subunit